MFAPDFDVIVVVFEFPGRFCVDHLPEFFQTFIGGNLNGTHFHIAEWSLKPERIVLQPVVCWLLTVVLGVCLSTNIGPESTHQQQSTLLLLSLSVPSAIILLLLGRKDSISNTEIGRQEKVIDTKTEEGFDASALCPAWNVGNGHSLENGKTVKRDDSEWIYRMFPQISIVHEYWITWR